YFDAEVPVVLGTDGYGIYQTTAALEARAARLAGLNESDLAQLHAVETKYVEQQQAWAEANLSSVHTFKVPDDLPHVHFTPAIIGRVCSERQLRSAKLLDYLTASGTPVLSREELVAMIGNRRCISFAGAWQYSWERISPDLQSIITIE